MAFEMLVDEFFAQLGPEYSKYASVFMENGFNDVATITSMHITEDLDAMFKDLSVPLGHRRRIETAIKNLNNAVKIHVEPIKNIHTIVDQNSQLTTPVPSMMKVELSESEKLKDLENKLDDAFNRKKELDVNVQEKETVGPMKSVRCSNCHARGHKSDGNKGKNACTASMCTSWKFCGQKERHKEYLSERKDVEKEIKSLQRQISEAKIEVAKIKVFQERSNASFISVIKPRIKALNKVKYEAPNILLRDVLALKCFYNGKIPTHDPTDDRKYFEDALEEMKKKKEAQNYNTEDLTPAKRKKEVETNCLGSQLPVVQLPAVQMPVLPQYNPFFYQSMMPYPFFNYSYDFSYWYSQMGQPPLPPTPPPSNPPLPKGPPPS